jgi:beta-carotene 3-hydroxylase
MLLGASVTVGTFLALEPITMLLHKYIMHGKLWKVHADHHADVAYAKPGVKANDLFPLCFAVPCALGACLAHLGKAPRLLLPVSIGALAYGLLYLYVHEELYHGRLILPGSERARHLPYVRLLLYEHGLHHANATRAYGFLWPWDSLSRGTELAPPRPFSHFSAVIRWCNYKDRWWNTHPIARLFRPCRELQDKAAGCRVAP